MLKAEEFEREQGADNEGVDIVFIFQEQLDV